MNTKLTIFSSVFLVLLTTQGQASVKFNKADPCMNHGQVLPVDDAAVIQMKRSEPNGYRSRAHVAGTVDKVYHDATGHRHFSISLDKASGDTIEVIYNQSFGAMPEASVGDAVEACGDFINSFMPEHGYQASPDGALLHWVHKSDTANHDSGFVILRGIVYGQLAGHGS